MSATKTNNSYAELHYLDKPESRFISFVLLMVAGIALLTASAKTQVPFWPVPMTLQTLAMMTIFAGFGLRLGLATILGYMALGLAGIPVFAGPVAGPLYFVGPTGGFLVGFVLAAIIVGIAADKGWSKSPLKLFGAMLFADIVVFALGFAWLGFMYVSAKSGTTLGAATAFKFGVQPYILADLVKMAIAAAIIPALWNLTKRANS